MRHLVPAILLPALLAGCQSAMPTASARAALHTGPTKTEAPAPTVSVAKTPFVFVTPGQPAPVVEPADMADEPPLPAEVLRMADGMAAEADGEASAKPVKSSLLTTWKTLISAAKSGQRTLLPGNLPPYPTLDAAMVAAAAERGAGRTLRLSALHGPNATRHSEPASLLVHGNKAAVAKAFGAAGWTKANSRSAWNFIKMGGSVITRLWNEEGSPVSAMELDGRLETFAFNKNSDYTLGRDHLRIYDLGGDAWAIAATRDLAATVTFHHPTSSANSRWKLNWTAPSFGHSAEDNSDLERDLVLDSLLGATVVHDWAVVQGQPAEEVPFQKQADGRLKISHYVTDGRIYEIWLK